MTWLHWVFWLAPPSLCNQALPFSCPLFSQLHPALDIPGHSQTHNVSLKTDLGEILWKRARVNIFFFALRDKERFIEIIPSSLTKWQQRAPHYIYCTPHTTLKTVLIIRLLPCFSTKYSLSTINKMKSLPGFEAHVGSPSFHSYLRLLRAVGAHLDAQPAAANISLSFIQPHMCTHPSVVVVSPSSAMGSPCDAIVRLNQGPLTLVWAWPDLGCKVKRTLVMTSYSWISQLCCSQKCLSSHGPL